MVIFPHEVSVTSVRFWFIYHAPPLSASRGMNTGGVSNGCSYFRELHTVVYRCKQPVMSMGFYILRIYPARY